MVVHASALCIGCTHSQISGTVRTFSYNTNNSDISRGVIISYPGRLRIMHGGGDFLITQSLYESAWGLVFYSFL